MRAMLLCAGLGTRLRPLSDLRPKPACPILDLPLCWYALSLLAGAGVGEVIANTHHRADEMAAALRRGGAKLGVEVEISHEPELLGTGGGLAKAGPRLRGGTFLLLNGDVLFDADLPAALAAHRGAGAAATMVVRAFPAGAPYRPVHVDEAGRVVRIAGEGPPPPGTTPWLFTGLHVLEPDILGRLPSGPSGLHEDGYGPLLRSGAKVVAHRDEGAWNDVGTPARYLEANLALAGGTLPVGRFAALGLPPAAEGQSSWIGDGAQIEGEVEGSVVGEGAWIPEGAGVRQSVVWPGTELRRGERLDRCIAAGSLRVPALKAT
ncbi:MAG: nucleotidyltransferase family protein [Myxococcales bacterium]